jgi:hypothetical protein
MKLQTEALEKQAILLEVGRRMKGIPEKFKRIRSCVDSIM